MAQISGNVEVNYIPTLRVEVKVPTVVLRMQNTLVMLAVTTLERPYTNTAPLWWGGILVAHIHRLHDDVCDLAIQVTTNHNQSK